MLTYYKHSTPYLSIFINVSLLLPISLSLFDPTISFSINLSKRT